MLVMSDPRPTIRCRQIGESDICGVVDLLARGFRSTKKFWRRALDRLGRHRAPEGFPRYGYLLESNGVPVGVVLLIFSTIPDGDGATIRCNISSWYAQPAFRSHASLLIAQALRYKNVTYLNVSPAPHTLPIIKAQGFSCFSSGQFVAFPALTPLPHVPVDVVPAERFPATADTAAERDLLAAHMDYGCIGLWCVTALGSHPFLFRPRLVKEMLPGVQLVYCRKFED